MENHTSVLRFLLSISSKPAQKPRGELRRLSKGVRHPTKRPVLLDWIEADTRSPSLFPFNVASVCTAWRDILAQIPECWTRVVFDVARDPTPLLDVFLWSQNLENLEVLIFNSSMDTEGVDKEGETRRVASIAQALGPHIGRCKTIVFDVVYSSSLPPSNIFFVQKAPNLEELILDCRIDDIDVEKENSASSVPGEGLTFVKQFPKMKKLSMTGFWFMNLALHGGDPDWMTKVIYPELVISQFKFLDVGHYTLPNFVSYLSRTLAFGSLYLRDLSISSGYGSPQSDASRLEIPGIHIHFQSVSKDFLAHFFAVASVSSLNPSRVFFDGCQVPKMRQICDEDTVSLRLKNIVDDETIPSLRNILESWSGSAFEVCSCPAFNDTFLSWLGRHVERIETKIESITIRDCLDFSPRALGEFCEAWRNAMVGKGRHRRFFDDLGLSVYGKGPALTKEDWKWFDENMEYINLNWDTVDEGGVMHKYSEWQMKSYSSDED